jgi:hypothetical protein
MDRFNLISFFRSRECGHHSLVLLEPSCMEVSHDAP